MSAEHDKLSIQDFAGRLDEIKKKRGYLMPHHGLLALTAPDLLAGYDACYSALTLGERQIPTKDKEFIWLGILAVREEYLATQHVTKFLDAGGSSEEIITATQLAAIARGVGSLSFAIQYWNAQVPEINGPSYYLDTLLKLTHGTPVQDSVLHLSMCAIHTSLQNWEALKWHLSWAYEMEINESYIAEALTYSMFTGSIPFFIEGCEIWRSMIANGHVDATEPFKLWAETDQSGPK